ncbi:hypothetical protein [Rhodococcus globerulus]|uniref:DUF4375 domain-containing protein n=1 Tax=Rhodococcus globerulus TaxID=33008 RepID=A0ABU4C3K8_RHOGO|nr:hypothetical protein [Rhodococcus globerulus]MDV6271087.1 hypothetical protein [Rhodococcus globerulus]
MSAVGTKKRDLLAHAKREFDLSVTEHEMTILRDDEQYRHIRFQKPGTSIYWFDLITWPYHLVISGDLEAFHFSREEDMFGFFAGSGSSYEHGINPHYWGEKIQGSAKWRVYSPELFTQLVVEDFWERRHDYEGDVVELWREIKDGVLEYAEFESEARSALHNFRHLDIKGGDFEFYDTWEWAFTDYDIHYLRSLHAIVWGIKKYRAAKAQS